jgi:hypothetical protein
VAGAVLGLLAVAELIAWGGGHDTGGNAQFALLLLGLATTVPLALLWAQPAAAAVAVCAASMLSLAAFHSLTVAGLVTLLIVVYRLGRGGSAALAAGPAAAFIPLAVVLTGPWAGATKILIVLLAAYESGLVVPQSRGRG